MRGSPHRASNVYGNQGLRVVPDGTRLTAGGAGIAGPDGGVAASVMPFEDPAFWLVVLIGVVIGLAIASAK